MNIGYIGLGLMGKPCAQNLIKAGHSVHIWARTPDKVADLVANGAVWCNSPADVASKVEILFTNVTNTDDVQQVLLGENGVVHGGKRGLIVADMSTISALATQKMAEQLQPHGIVLADCPVSGGTVGAINGTLTVMVGSDEDTFHKLKPVLEAMGSKITLIGGTGAGQVCKSCNQIILTATLLGVSEAFSLATKMKVDIANIREALLGGFANSKVLETHALRMINDDYTPGFKTSLHLKDMKIVKDLASDLGMKLPAGKLGVETLSQAVDAGYGEIDSSSLYKIVNKN